MSARQLTQKQFFERSNRPYTYFVVRPVGRWLLPSVIRLGLSPNQITLMSIFGSLAAMALLATGAPALVVAGVAALHVGIVLDIVDGDLARATGKVSRRGEFLDALGGYVRGAMIPASIGIGLGRHADLGHELLSGVFTFSPDVYVQVGVWASVMYLGARLATLRYRTLFGDSLRDQFGWLGRAALSFDTALPLFLVVGAVTQTLSLVLLAFALYYVASGLYAIIASCVSAGTQPSAE